MIVHFTFLSCAITFGVGFFCFALAASEDGINDLGAINEIAKIPQNQVETLKQISEFIQMNSIFKQLRN